MKWHSTHGNDSSDVYEKYNRWTVLDSSSYGWVLCRCACGTTKKVRAFDVRSGKSKSCGCWRAEVSARKATKHGACGTPEWKVWVGMRSRCAEIPSETTKDYGSRGIRVCKRWSEFENFLADMGPRPGSQYSIERRDANGDYCPENCYWLPRSLQSKNTRKTRLITIGDKTLCIAEWSRISGVDNSDIAKRLNRGVPPEEAVFRRGYAMD